MLVLYKISGKIKKVKITSILLTHDEHMNLGNAGIKTLHDKQAHLSEVF